MDIANGFVINGKSRGKLKHWSGLLHEWSSNIERYMKYTNGDIPYWYKERANVSILAGAAWRSGFIALQEFEADKQISVDETTISELYSWKGRCDLYIGSSTNQHDLIEAKYKWLSLKSDDFNKYATNLVNKALADAKASQCGGDISAVGVAFIPVYLHAKYMENIDDIIKNTIAQIKEMELDAYAWCFPNTMRQRILDNNYLNPGIFLFAKSSKYEA